MSYRLREIQFKVAHVFLKEVQTIAIETNAAYVTNTKFKLKSDIMKKFDNQPFLELKNKIRHKVFEI